MSRMVMGVILMAGVVIVPACTQIGDAGASQEPLKCEEGTEKVSQTLTAVPGNCGVG